MSRDPRRELEEAGARQVPAPDTAFADALEARLRAVATSMPPAPPAATPKPTEKGWRRWSRWPLGPLAPLAAGLVVTALVLAVAGQGGSVVSPTEPPLELSAAVNVVVQLVDGTTIQNPEGMVLPEGAIVTVGAGGSARIGNLTVNAGEVVVVQGGRAQVERPRPSAPGTAFATPAPRSSNGTPSSAPGSGGPGPTPGASPSPAIQPTPTPDPSAAPSPGPTASPTPSPVPILAPKVVARLVAPHTIAVHWTRTAGARTYVLVITRSKTGLAPRPTYPGSKVLGTFSKPPGAPVLFVLGPGVVQVKLMVVALDKNGNELARSRIVRVVVAVPIASPSPTPSPS